jgi:hypothetical protein
MGDTGSGRRVTPPERCSWRQPYLEETTSWVGESRRAGIVLIELGVVEQRHKAVLEVMEGLPVTEVAGRYGVQRFPAIAMLTLRQPLRLRSFCDPHARVRMAREGIPLPPL